MEYEQIKKILEDMGNSKLSEVSIEFPDGAKISMKKDFTKENTCKKSENTVNSQEISEPKKVETETQEKVEDCKIIKSPMVGTFYSKPAPDAESYVHIGQDVKKGDVVCVIEAMKLINEIESEFDGKIVEILVNDGEMVDYGKPLFKVK